ncbi:MAG: hypothetical protein MJZ87_04240 [Bacteroidales bacterium]|nr:hypothetical protein [Bacteroidales bacterium]
MSTENLNFADKIYHYVKQFLNRITYSQDLFDEEIWHVRFSKLHQPHKRYTIEKKTFSLSLKNSDDIFKYLLWISLIVMLVSMVLMSRHVGISTREIEQNHYSELVYNHFHHIGDDGEFKAHPYASAQAQYIDVMLYSIGKSLHVQDIFLLKHLVSAIFGWLLIVYLSILILKAFSWRAAFFTAFLLFISPRFVGYSVSNVVDVTFAFGFIFTITQMYYFCRELPVIRIYRMVKIVLGMLLALSISNAGFILLNFFTFFVILNFILYNPLRRFYKLEYLKTLGTLCLMILGFYVFIYAVHAIGTMFLVRSAVAPRDAFELLTINYPFAQNQLFEGHIIGPDNFPRYYLAKYLFITIPTIVLIGFLLFFVFFKTAVKALKPYSIFIFLYSFFFCIHKVRSNYMNPDTMWSIYYCIYPLFILISVSGIECTLRSISDKYTNFVVLCLIALLSFMPIRHIAFNQPFTSIYFNEISGGLHNAYAKYELGIYDNANKNACLWLKDYLYREEIGQHATNEKYVVATNGNAACGLFFAGDTNMVMVHAPFNAADTTWDFYIDFCHEIPAAQLRNGTWPTDSTLRTLRLETKPIVAFYENSFGTLRRQANDSLAVVEDEEMK